METGTKTSPDTREKEREIRAWAEEYARKNRLDTESG